MNDIPKPININWFPSSNWGLCCYWFTNSGVPHVVVTNGKELKATVLWWPSNIWRHILWHSVSWFNRWSGHTDGQYCNMSNIMCGLLEGKLTKIQILTSPCCSCVLVCLSVAFKLLNSVTLLQMWCENYDDFVGHQEALGFVFRHLVLMKWRACELLRFERCMLYTVCY